MFALERIRIIKNYLMENRQAEVNQLSQMLGVSEVTIRRDLEKLEREEFLTRTHGGAMLNTADQSAAAENQSISQEFEEISNIALRMIMDDDIIMLTNGELNLMIARKLSVKNRVTVLTNDIRIASQILDDQSAKVVLLGGNLDYHTNAVFGTLTIDNLRKFFVNRLFIEVDGISSRLDLTVSSIDMASFIQEAVNNANEQIVVCSAEAFSRISFYRVGRAVDLCNKIITSHKISEQHKNAIFNANIQLFTSINLFEGKV
jgi:DeoR/GlpR family transcriptional regulator of sugar metabolism